MYHMKTYRMYIKAMKFYFTNSIHSKVMALCITRLEKISFLHSKSTYSAKQ